MKYDDWIDFEDNINAFLKKQKDKISQIIITKEELNKGWHILNQAIRQAANTNIPMTKNSPKVYHAFSKKAMKLHTALQKINLIICQLNNNQYLD